MNTSSKSDMALEAEEQLLHSLDEAVRDLDAGKGLPISEVRKWIAVICSTQKSTDGIGDNIEYFNDAPNKKGAVVRERTYFARLKSK